MYPKDKRRNEYGEFIEEVEEDKPKDKSEPSDKVEESKIEKQSDTKSNTLRARK